MFRPSSDSKTYLLILELAVGLIKKVDPSHQLNRSEALKNISPSNAGLIPDISFKKLINIMD